MVLESASRDAQDETRFGLRWLPPVHSPITLMALVRASAAGLTGDPRATFAESLTRDYAAAAVRLTDSGTHALQLAIQVALRSAPAGDAPIVALPAYSCFDVATAAVGTGADIVLYDLDPVTLSPDLDSLDRALSRGARAVVVAPLYGMPVDWDAVEQCAARFGAIAIEDAAQGHGAMWRGRRVGASGRLSVLSFGRGKGWTGGVGGALLAKDAGALLGVEELVDVRSATGSTGTLARSAAQWLLARPALYALPASLPFLHLGETNYRDPSPARMMPPAAAALLQATRTLANEEAVARRANADEFIAGIAALSIIGTVRSVVGATPGFLRFPLRLPRGLDGFAAPRAAFRLGLARGYPATLDQLPAVRERLVSAATTDAWTGAAELVKTLITLPTHSLVTASERRHILRLIAGYRVRA